MIDNEDYIVDVKAWKAAPHPNYMKLKEEPDGKDAYWAYSRLNDEWNLRTSGAGRLWPTLLYSLRAHKRGKVHCHDFDLEKQAEFLKKAELVLRPFLKERESIPEGVQATA